MVASPSNMNLDGNITTSLLSEWDDKQKKMHSYNAKAMNAFFFSFFFFALNHMEFTRVKNCKTTFEIWKILEVTHQVS